MKNFFSFIRENSPTLKKDGLPFVTNQEIAITNAIQNNLPNTKLVYCWNHLFRDVDVWLKKHSGKCQDVAFYYANLRSFLEAQSYTMYCDTLKKLRPHWDAEFEEYYMKYLHGDILTGAGQWILEDLKIYCPYSGIMNNQSESLNRYVMHEWS